MILISFLVKHTLISVRAEETHCCLSLEKVLSRVIRQSYWFHGSVPEKALLSFRICLLLGRVDSQRSHSCCSEIESENMGEGKQKGSRVRDTMRERKWKCMWVSVLGLWGQDRLALVCAAFSTGSVPGPGGEVTEGMAALLASACCLPFKENQCLGDEMAVWTLVPCQILENKVI